MLRWLPEPALSFAPLASAPRPRRRPTGGSGDSAVTRYRVDAASYPRGLLSPPRPRFPRPPRTRERPLHRIRRLRPRGRPGGRSRPQPPRHPLRQPPRNYGPQCPFEYFLKYLLDLQPPEEYVLGCRRLAHSRRPRWSPAFRLLPLPEATSPPPDAPRTTPATSPPARPSCSSKSVPERAGAPAAQPGGLRAANARNWTASRTSSCARKKSFCRESQPICFEAAIGLKPKGDPGLLDARSP